MAVALALLASLLYGVSNYLGPTLSRRAPLFLVLLVGQAVALTVSGALATTVGGSAPDGAEAGAALLAGVGNAVGLLCFYRATLLGPLSLVTPIGAIGAAVPVIAGLADGEAASTLKILGIALALGGVALAARRPGGQEVHQDRRAAVAWALASALAFGVFLAAMAPAADGGVLWAVFLSRMSLLTIVLATALVLGQALRAPVTLLPQLALPGVLLFAGTLAYSAATTEGDLSVVSVLGSLFPVVTIGLAFALLGERLTRGQAAGVAAAFLGTVLLSAR